MNAYTTLLQGSPAANLKFNGTTATGTATGGTRAVIIQAEEVSNQWPFTMYYMPAIVVCEAEDAIKIGKLHLERQALQFF